MTELQVSQITEFIKCRRNWKKHNNMNRSDRNPKRALKYQQKGK
jgi:hypothetical protein